APVHRSHRLVQALGGMGEEGDVLGWHAEPPRHAPLGPLVHAEDLLAPRHARALEPPEAGAGGIVRAEPGRLAAGAEMGDALEADELGLRDQAHRMRAPLTRGWPAAAGR